MGRDYQCGRISLQKMRDGDGWSLIKNKVTSRELGFVRNTSVEMILIGRWRLSEIE